MKRISNYIFALLLIIAVAGCVKNSAAPSNDALVTPQGSFIGTFTLIHKNSKTSVLDTSRATITIAMPANAATYSVAGDTTKIQAASYGTFFADGTLITFADATVNKKTDPNAPKKHLNGPYLYTYDGTNLHIYGSSDTLNFSYTLVSY